jgi:hypothetical protein
MKTLRLVLFVSAMLASSIAWSDDAAKIEAGKMLDSMGMETVLGQAIETTLDEEIRQQPNLTPYKGVMLEFFRKYMSYKSLRPELVELYANEFSAAELKEMRTFYETPTGKKAIEKMPVLMSKGSQIGVRRVQENMPELEQMMKDETEKIAKKEKEQEQGKQKKKQTH